MRSLLAFCIAASIAHAQLATNYDGSELLLASYWKLWGAAATEGPAAVYRYRSGQWTVIPAATGNVGQPGIAADGRTIWWERFYPCFRPCMFALPRSTSEVEGLTGELKIHRYLVTFSENGRFALTPGFHNVIPWAMQDLETGTVWTSASAALTGVTGVSDNGTVTGINEGHFAVWRPGGEVRRLMPATEPMILQISANSRSAVVQTGSYAGERRLWLIDISSGTRQLIAQLETDDPADIVPWSPLSRTMSSDGSRVLFFATGPNRRLNLFEQGGARTLAQIPEGVLHMTLSGDGRVAFVLTRNGRLLMIDTATAESQDLAGGLPISVSQIFGGAVPGSVLQLRGFGSFEGVEFEAGGIRFPVVETRERGFAYIQIPWEFAAAAETPATVNLRREGSPFFMPANVSISRAVQPWLVLRNDSAQFNELKAVLPDWSGLVTAETPAQPGTTVHAYMFRLGALDRPVPTGEPGPSNPAAHPLIRMACYLRGPDDNPMPRALELPFIAYAPGLVGAYQVDMTIPADWPAGRHFINCESSVRGYTSAAIHVGARAQ